MNNGHTPLHAAAGNGYDAVMRQLIDARCNIDLQDENGYTVESKKLK
jgi:ankyrin repeat protein